MAVTAVFEFEETTSDESTLEEALTAPTIEKALCSAHCVFRRKVTDFMYAYILLYVDDLFVFAPTAE